jgi:hypothetical protein
MNADSRTSSRRRRYAVAVAGLLLLASCGSDESDSVSTRAAASTTAAPTAAPTTAAPTTTTPPPTTTTRRPPSGQAFRDVCNALTLDEIRVVLPDADPGTVSKPSDNTGDTVQCVWRVEATGSSIYLRIIFPGAFFNAGIDRRGGKTLVDGADNVSVNRVDGVNSMGFDMAVGDYFVLLSILDKNPKKVPDYPTGARATVEHATFLATKVAPRV